MRSVVERFAAYELADHLVTATEPLRVAWLSGQSSYRHHRLSPAQLGLLDAVADLGYRPVRAAFPYNSRAMAAPDRDEPLVRAAVRNVAQFLASRFDPCFAAEVARHVSPLVEYTDSRLLLICGSSGLEH
jgi:hypothetical protein